MKSLPSKEQTSALKEMKMKYAQFLAKQIAASPNAKFKIEDEEVYEMVEDCLDVIEAEKHKKQPTVKWEKVKKELDKKHGISK